MSAPSTSARHHRHFSRRSFLLGSLAGAVVAVVTGTGLWIFDRRFTPAASRRETGYSKLRQASIPAAEFDSTLPKTEFQTLLRDTVLGLQLAPDVGKAFLDTRVGRMSSRVTDLIEDVRNRVDLPVSGVHNDPAALTAALKEAITKDFEEGRICYVEDWYLSITECRLAALKHLFETTTPEAHPTEEILAGLTPGPLWKVAKWGPRQTSKGKPFNRQPSGASSLWFTGEGAEKGLVAVLGPHVLTTTHRAGLITADLSPSIAKGFLGDTGSHEVLLIDTESGVKQSVGTFEIVE